MNLHKKVAQEQVATSPMASVSKVDVTQDEEGLVLRGAEPQSAQLGNSLILSTLPQYLSHLPDEQSNDIITLMLGFPSLFNDVPSQTTVIKHVLLTKPTPIKQRAYWVSPAKREIIKQEVEYILQNGFAVPSSSSWSSPCLLDTKSDGTPRFCTDFRKVNSVTVPDAHPLPLIDDCIDEIGPAKYIAKLDMLKGYWQVPFTLSETGQQSFGKHPQL